jgi:hypothetical protein
LAARRTVLQDEARQAADFHVLIDRSRHTTHAPSVSR